jgi:hypothetical protein
MAEYIAKLGSTPFPNEHRIHRVSWTDIRWQVRSVNADVFVRFTHPTISDFVDDATTCAFGAAGAGVIAGVASGQIAAAFAVFYPAWKVCMVAKVGLTIATETSVELFTEKTYGHWADF